MTRKDFLKASAAFAAAVGLAPASFAESPFYFEAGVNGGWSGHNGGGIEANPAFRVKQICMHLAKGPGRIPDSAFQLMRTETMRTCCCAAAHSSTRCTTFRRFARFSRRVSAASAPKSLTRSPDVRRTIPPDASSSKARFSGWIRSMRSSSSLRKRRRRGCGVARLRGCGVARLQD